MSRVWPECARGSTRFLPTMCRAEGIGSGDPQVSAVRLPRSILAEPRPCIVDLRENIAEGQIVSSYSVEALVGSNWQTLTRGTTIGYRKLDRVTPVEARRVRVRIEHALERPRPLTVRLYR